MSKPSGKSAAVKVPPRIAANVAQKGIFPKNSPIKMSLGRTGEER